MIFKKNSGKNVCADRVVGGFKLKVLTARAQKYLGKKNRVGCYWGIAPFMISCG